ncbi:jouberin [Patella vulgata]|uniref:jouberin n=1 Tax=Patella vulgata TaxID=6465 RepID=UPI00217F6544|nr:jouberin [Patella vulgata]
MAEETDGVVKPKPRKSRTKSSKLKDEEIISDVTANGSRLSVDEILQQAVQKSNKDSSTDKKKRKKKSKHHDGDIEMLEYLRKGEEIESLQKDKDTAILANTYEPDNSPKNEKSNRRRQKHRESKSGTDNLAFDKDSNIQIIEETIIKKKKTKKKIIKDGSELEKESSKIITLSNAQDLKSPTVDVISTAEGIISPTSPEVKKKTKKKKKKEESEDEIIESPAEVVESVTELMGAQPEKKKKKKKKPVAIDSEDTVVQQNNEIAQEQAAEEEKTEPKLETPKKMKRKKKKTKEEGETTALGTGEGIEEEQQPLPREIQDEGKILAVTIHRTDKLKNNFNIMHPLVRVHIVDLNTGNYVLKQHKDRAR